MLKLVAILAALLTASGALIAQENAWQRADGRAEGVEFRYRLIRHMSNDTCVVSLRDKRQEKESETKMSFRVTYLDRNDKEYKRSGSATISKFGQGEVETAAVIESCSRVQEVEVTEISRR
jgi:hypothetical protein